MRAAVASSPGAARRETILWLAQRASAAMLAVCVVVHLALILYAVRGGLSAAEVLGRTRGSLAWLAFYLVFVLAAAVHAPIGLRAILREWTSWRGASLDVCVAGVGAFLAIIGVRAALAVFQ
jgi:fumarate reductase subunit C